jgi:hypothetical protein
VVLSGAIGDFGAAVSVLPNGKVDTEHSSQFKLALTQGSLRIVINEVDAKPGCQPFSGSALLAQSIFTTGSGTVSFH